MAVAALIINLITTMGTSRAAQLIPKVTQTTEEKETTTTTGIMVTSMRHHNQLEHSVAAVEDSEVTIAE